MTEASNHIPEEQRLSLGFALDILRRGRWILLASAVVCSALGVLYVQQRGTIWRSTTRLNVSKPGTAADDLQKAILGVASKTFAYEQADALVSDEVLRRTLKSEIPADEHQGGTLVHELEIFDGASDEAELTLNQKIDWLAENLDVSVGRDNEVISVSLDSRHRADVYVVVNALATAFVDYTSEQRKNTAMGLANQYGGDLDALVELADAADAELNDVFRQQSELLSSSAGGPVGLLGKIRRQEVERDELKRVVITAELELAALERGSPIWDPRLVATEQLVLQQSRIKRAQGALQYTEIDPRLKRLDAEVRAVEEQYDAAVERARELKRIELETRVETARRSVANLEASIGKDSEKLQKASSLKATELRLLRQLERYRLEREQKQQLVNRITEQLATNNINSFGVEIRKEANVERLEDVSGRPMRLALALLIGLLVGAGITWFREMLDQRIRSAEEAANLLELPLLGAMPRISGGEDGDATSIIERWGNDPLYAESARSLRTQVFFGLPADEAQVLQVASPEQGDGKSTTIANLAIAMAKAGQRTLLVDADMRRPRQAEMFGVEPSSGLSALLAGKESSIERAVCASGVEHLDVLGAGAVPADPAELLSSTAFVQLVQELRGRYDRVLIDSPPVLPVADASILGPRCDATLLVLRAEKSTRNRSRAAKESLLRVGGRVLGMVFNDVSVTKGGRYHDGYGYYGSGYVQEVADAGLTTPQSARSIELVGASGTTEELNR